MKDNKPEPQADALDKYLRASGDHLTPGEDHPVFRRGVSPPEAETRLAEDIRRLAQEIQPPPGFEKELEQALERAAQQRRTARQRRPGLGCWIGLGGLALLLFAGLAWTAHALLSRAPAPASTQAAVAPAATTPAGTGHETAPLPAETAAETAAPPPPAPTPGGPIYSLAIQPEVDFLLEAAFPAAPAEAGVYRQAPPAGLTLESARERAAQLGVEGEIYQSPTRPDGYVIWDGAQKLVFYGSPASFLYETGDPAQYEKPACAPPCLPDGAAEALSGFLDRRGLLALPVEARPSDVQAGTAQLVQMVEGRPLLYGPGEYQGEALIGADGRVLRLDYNPAGLERLESFPILSAEQAWEAATQAAARRGMVIASRSVPAAGFVNWARPYPAGEPVEVFGSVTVYPSATGGAPLLMTGNLPLAGNTTGMESAARINPFLQIVGQIEADAAGRRTLQVTGWQASPFPRQTLSGRVERQGGAAYLNTGERVYLLPDLPSGVPSEGILTANGVVIEQPELTLSWSSITTGPDREGRSAGSFRDLNLPGVPRAPQSGDGASAAPGRAGERLDGARGQPFVIIHEYADGSTRAEVRFTLDPPAEGEPAPAFPLEGPGLAGIEAYHNLPLRVWGAFDSAADGSLVFALERYEPVYPGLRLQAWLGRYEPAALDGGEALLFITQEDEELALGSLTGQPIESLEFAPGDPLIIEGYLLPDQELEGRPVLHHTAIFPAQGVEELSDYTLVSDRPQVIREAGTAGAAKTAFVRQVELAYYTPDPRQVDLSNGAAPPFAQPVWRFSGAYEDGTRFEILVQALADEVLRQD